MEIQFFTPWFSVSRLCFHVLADLRVAHSLAETRVKSSPLSLKMHAYSMSPNKERRYGLVKWIRRIPHALMRQTRAQCPGATLGGYAGHYPTRAVKGMS